MEETKKEARIHPWVYTIIPVKTNSTSIDQIVFTAYCKACRSYFTERMPFDEYRGMLSKASIPRYGCEPISEDVSVL